MKLKYDIVKFFFLVSAVAGVAISYSYIYLVHIVSAILLLLFFYKITSDVKFEINKLPSRLHYFFYVMFGWYSLSIIWSIKRAYSIKYLFYIFYGILIILIIIRYSTTVEKQNIIFKVLAVIFIIEIIFSLMESFTMFRLPVSPYSKYAVYFGREMNVNMDIEKRILSIIFSRPTGFRWNPNKLAATMIIILPFFLFKKKYI